MSPAPPEDPVMLLLPDAPAEDLELAHALTRAMHVFSSDAVDSGSSSVCVQLGHARDELDLYHTGSVESLLQDLAIHAAAEALPRATLLALPLPRRSYAAAWRDAFAILSVEERERLGVAVPAPGASSLDLLGQLVEALAAHAESLAGSQRGLSGGQLRANEPAEPGGQRGGATIEALAVQHWRIRERWLAEPAAALEIERELEALLARLARLRGHGVRSLRAAVLGDMTALALDQGRVESALETVRRAGPGAQRAEDCRTPLDLLAVGLRWWKGGQELPRLGPAYARCSARGELPEVWDELLNLCGDPSSRLAASVAAGGSQGSRRGVELSMDRSAAATSRQTFGASALVVSLLRPDGTFEVVHADVAPGLSGSLDRWQALHRLAVSERGAPEHEAIRLAKGVALLDAQERPRDGSDLSSFCLAGRGCGPSADGAGLRPRALVVEPLLDSEGEPLGLLWLELPTRLIPARSQRAAAARALAHRYAGAAPTLPARAQGTDIRIEGEARGPLGERRAGEDLQTAWESAVASLQLKTAERRWIAFHVCGSVGLRAVARGGCTQDRLGEPDVEGAWAVKRSLRIGGPIRYSLETEEGELAPAMLHRGAASGAALPLLRGGRVFAVLSLESTRRGDAREADVTRWFDALQAQAPSIEATALSIVDRETFDGGWALEPEDPGFQKELAGLKALGAAGFDVLVKGEVGTGRRTWARMVHHAGAADGKVGSLITRAAFGLSADEIRQWGEEEAVRTVVVADLEWLAPPAQAELLRLCARPQGQRPRVLATAGGADDRSLPAGQAHPQLMRAFGRAVVLRPPLRGRRHGIPALVRFMQRRIAHREGGGSAVLEDPAMALLWRQPWAENATTLEGVLYALHLHASAAPEVRPSQQAESERAKIGAQRVASVLVDAGLDPLLRLPSRSPLPSDVFSALWVTRTATRRLNKTRAAQYLGWDPNTLAARLKELGIGALKDVQDALQSDQR